jgi:hypothetical protein
MVLGKTIALKEALEDLKVVCSSVLELLCGITADKCT